MKRECTQYEKEILFKNENNMLSGSLSLGKGQGYGIIIFSTFLGLLLFAGLVVLDIILTDKAILKEQPDWLVLLISAVVADVLTIMITIPIRKAKKKKAVKKEKDAIINNYSVMVNVGEIATIDHDKIGFFEDGVNLPNGNRVIIDYPIEYKEGINFVVGEKILIVYLSKYKNTIMKITPETMNIFNSFELMEPIDQMTRNMAFHVPHQNAIYAMYGARHFTENDRMYLENYYSKLLKNFQMKIARKRSNFLGAQTVVLKECSQRMQGNAPVNVLHVYEYEDGQFVEKQYDAPGYMYIPPKEEPSYGKLFMKYWNEKKMAFVPLD